MLEAQWLERSMDGADPEKVRALRNLGLGRMTHRVSERHGHLLPVRAD